MLGPRGRVLSSSRGFVIRVLPVSITGLCDQGANLWGANPPEPFDSLGYSTPVERLRDCSDLKVASEDF
jgi:hypothetical protein